MDDEADDDRDISMIRSVETVRWGESEMLVRVHTRDAGSAISFGFRLRSRGDDPEETSEK